jgi:hypothetical protein
MENKQYIVSFSGGRTSAYMLFKMIEKHGKENVLPVFANTSKELPETLDFIEKCSIEWDIDIVWLQALIQENKGEGTTYEITDYKNAKRKGEIFDSMIGKYGLPNKNYPHCTRELKQRPITKYLKDHFPNLPIAIGYRIDEKRRINRDKAEKENWIFPLVDEFPTWRMMVRSFWSQYRFDLDLKDYEGNCDFCWKKSQKKRLTLIKERPNIADNWEQWENESEFVFDRDGIRISKLKELATKPFRKAIDELELMGCNPELFAPCICFS